MRDDLEFLRGALERLFELEELIAMTSSLLGMNPAELEGMSNKAAFVRSLVERCAAEHRLEALVDAIQLSSSDSDSFQGLTAIGRAIGPQLPPGAELGSFRILSLLEADRLSVTYLAERVREAAAELRLAHGEHVAIKVLGSRISKDRSAVNRYLTAQRACSELRSLHLPTVYEVGWTEDGRAWVASTYLEGPTLADRLRQVGAFCWNEVAEALRGVLAGLKDLHARGLVHGDVNPQNIRLVWPAERDRILCPSDETKSLELTTDRQSPHARPTGALVGAALDRLFAYGINSVVRYIAPEVARGEGASPGSDLYQFGATVFESLTAVAPCSTPLFSADVQDPSRHRPATPIDLAPSGGVSQELSDLVMRALSPNPSDRPDANAFLEALKALSEPEPPPVDAHSEDHAPVELPGDLMDAELLLERLERTEDDAKRIPMLRDLARIYEREPNAAAQALLVWVQLLILDPKDERAVPAIERLASTPELWNEAIAMLHEAIAELDPSDQARIYLLMGRWYAEHLHRPDFALPCFTEALTRDPSSAEALQSTIALHRDAQSFPELAHAYLQRAARARHPANARDDRVKAARVILEHLNDEDRAVRLLQEVLSEDTLHPAAGALLQQYYLHSKRWRELALLFEARAQDQTPESRVRTLLSLGEVFEDHLDDVPRATATYERVLSIVPHHMDALKGLERTYAQSGQVSQLLESLGAQLDWVATPRERIALLERIGAIWEQEFVDEGRALAAFEQIVAIEPGHEAANRVLTRIYRKSGDLLALADTLERRAQAAESATQEAGLLLQAAHLLTDEPDAADRANQLCERVLRLHEDDVDALSLVAKLKSKAGAIDSAVHVLDRLATMHDDPCERAEYWIRSGALLAGSGGDEDAAIERFKRALDADPANQTAMLALRERFEARGDFLSVAALLEKELEHTAGDLRRARLLADLGARYAHDLHQPEKARVAFEAAHALDPTDLSAPLELGAIAFEGEDWFEVVRWYEPLLNRFGSLNGDDAVSVGLTVGDAFQALEEYEKARQAFVQVHAFTPNQKESSGRLASLAYASGSLDEAAELYQDWLDRYGETLDDDERGLAQLRRGDALRQLGQIDEAVQILRQAEDRIPWSTLALEALRLCYRARNDHASLAQLLERRLERASDEERFQLLLEIGDLAAEEMEDHERATQCYLAAAEIRENDRNLLARLMRLYAQTKSWSQLVEVLLRIANLVEDVSQRIKYRVTAASILQQELHRYGDAAEHYEYALGMDATGPLSLSPLDASERDGLGRNGFDRDESDRDDPDRVAGQVKAFEGLVECLTQQQEWERLVSVYRRYLETLEAHGSAEMHRAHLAHSSHSERASSNIASHYGSLAEILLEQLDREEEALIALEHARMLDPSSVQVLRLSHRVYLAAGRFDESFCVCQTLHALKSADEAEEKFFQQHRRKHPLTIESTLTTELFWSHVAHPQLDPLLTQIFDLICPAVIATTHQELSRFEVDLAEVDLETDPAEVVKMLGYVSKVMQVPLPPLHYRKSDPGGLSALFTKPPAIGLGAGVLAGGPPPALAFVAARHLSFFRDGLYLSQLLPSGPPLRSWLIAAIKSSVPEFPAPSAQEMQINEVRTSLVQHLPANQRSELDALVLRLIESARALNMNQWLLAVDRTADRVGLLCSDDLQTAAAVISATPEHLAPSGREERLKALYLYSASKAYLQLRQKLHIALRISPNEG